MDKARRCHRSTIQHDRLEARTPCNNPKLEQALFLWHKSHETRGSPISGEILTAKAKGVAARPELEVTEGFKCSYCSSVRAVSHDRLSLLVFQACAQGISRYHEFCRTIVSVRYIYSHPV